MNSILPITVVIPTLNEEKRLGNLLSSINSQTFRPAEIIIADSPKTTDNTRKIAKEMGARVVEGGIVALGRNNGAKAAKNEYILFFDADCKLPHEFFIGELFIYFQKMDLDICSTFVDFDKEEMSGMTMINRVAPQMVSAGYNMLKRLNNATKQIMAEFGGCILIRKQVFEDLGGFMSTTEMIGEDYEFSKRAVKAGYKYQVLPLNIITSARRYNTPRKAIRSVTGVFLNKVFETFGVYNNEVLYKLVKEFYGDLGEKK